MAWLKLDDGFARHRKVLELSEGQRWRWVTLLLDCARQYTQGGRVTAAMLREVRLPASRLLELGLLDAEGDVYWVHDWEHYNPASNAEALKQKRYRMRKAGVPEDEVLRIAPLKRDVTRDVTVTAQKDLIHARAFPSPNPTSDGNQRQTPPEDPARESATATPDDLCDALGELEPASMDYIYGAAARVPPELVAGIIASLGAHSSDPVGYALESLRRAL